MSRPLKPSVSLVLPGSTLQVSATGGWLLKDVAVMLRLGVVHQTEPETTEGVELAQQPEAVVLHRGQGGSGGGLCAFGRHCSSAGSNGTDR